MDLIKYLPFLVFSPSVIHCKPFMSLEPVNCAAEFTDFSGPFQLIMWKKMMHVLHTSKFTLKSVKLLSGAALWLMWMVILDVILTID